MRSRPSSEHQQAVARRLAQLRAELAASRTTAEEAEPGAWTEEPAEDWTAPHTHVPAARLAPPAPPDPAPAAPAPPVPVPGRHASRRQGRLLEAVLPDSLRGRVLLGPAQVAVLAVLVAIGLAATCWWVVRGGADEVVAPVVPSPAADLLPASAAPTVDEAAAASGSPTADATGTVTVDVAGKVRHPGIAVLDAGARVVDALKAAGGARPGVDLSGLNLARLLVDGEQILVGVPAPIGLAASAAPSPGTAPGQLVNLNTASEADLEELPEVGPVTAQAILAWRDQHGGFTAVDELLEVDGIGDATLGKLAPLVTV